MRRALLFCCIGVMLCAGAGCVYLHDRAMDFADVTGIKIVAGRGTKVGVGFFPGIAPLLPESLLMIPPLGQTGFDEVYAGLNFGYYDFRKYGYHGRAAGIWHERGWEIILPIDHELEPMFGNHFLFDSALDYQDRDVYLLEGKTYDHILSYPKSRFHHYGDVQLTFVPFLVGLEVNFSVFELVDFVVGFIHLDIADDDTRNYTPVGRRTE